MPAIIYKNSWDQTKSRECNCKQWPVTIKQNKKKAQSLQIHQAIADPTTQKTQNSIYIITVIHKVTENTNPFLGLPFQ